MRRLQQLSSDKLDCGVACVAMVADVTYRAAFNALRFGLRATTFSTTHADIIRGLRKLGWSAQKVPFEGLRAITGRAIVKVNPYGKGRWHWIVFSSEGRVPYVYDPNPLRQGRITDFRGIRGHGRYLLVTRKGAT